jgi:hypothetical protein
MPGQLQNHFAIQGLAAGVAVAAADPLGAASRIGSSAMVMIS